jgi:vesicular inhibitory amino acid transporter
MRTMAPTAGSATPARAAWFTLEDSKAAFNIFCTVCGIGSLGMPANYARAGPLFATIAIVFMALSNIYATVALSKVLLVAPSSVKTYGDLGEWVMGKFGRWIIVISHLGVCLLAPCAFLVLSGQLLDVLFPDAFSQTYWIVFTAVIVIPVAIIPTLKEGAGMALAGCFGTIIADVIAVAVLLYNLRGHPSVPSTDVSAHQVIMSFGNLSLAYAAAIVVPDLQRQHSEPRRMPRVIWVSLGLVSIFFLVLAIVGYSGGGCQISGNILFSIANTSDPNAATTLGFTADRGAVIMSYMFMQVHLTIAFCTILQPPFYMLERFILGMHKVNEDVTDAENNDMDELQEKVSFNQLQTPSEGVHSTDLESNSHGDNTVDERLSLASKAEHDEDAEYKGTRNVLRYVCARIGLIAVLCVASILLRDHFLDLVDFTGATFITVCSLLMPLVFYLKVLWNKIPIYEKALSLVIILICLIAGVYVMIYAGKNLFNPDESSTTFPYCHEEYQNEPYYVRNTTS